MHALETRRVAGVEGTLATADRSPLARSIDGVTDLLRLTTPSIATGTERRVKTMWEVAAGAGLRTAVVNWWATWPAPADAGIVVTDRATLRLERGGGLDAEIAPPEVYETLRARWPALREEASAAAARMHSPAATAGMLRRSVELDALQLGITRSITSATTDLVCTYLPGLDLVQHALFAGDGAQTAAAAAERLAALEQYYVALDSLLAPVAPAFARRDRLRRHRPRPGAARLRRTVRRRRRGGQHAVEGRIARATDVMPTVLHALGIPISRELAGRPLVEMFSATFAQPFTCARSEHLRIANRRPRAANGATTGSGNDRSAAQPRVREMSRRTATAKSFNRKGTGGQEICFGGARSKACGWQVHCLVNASAKAH